MYRFQVVLFNVNGTDLHCYDDTMHISWCMGHKKILILLVSVFITKTLLKQKHVTLHGWRDLRSDYIIAISFLFSY